MEAPTKEFKDLAGRKHRSTTDVERMDQLRTERATHYVTRIIRDDIPSISGKVLYLELRSGEPGAKEQVESGTTTYRKLAQESAQRGDVEVTQVLLREALLSGENLTNHPDGRYSIVEAYRIVGEAYSNQAESARVEADKYSRAHGGHVSDDLKAMVDGYGFISTLLRHAGEGNGGFALINQRIREQAA